MSLEYTSLTLKGQLRLPSRKRAIDLVYGDADLPQVPIMTNSMALPKGSKLACLDDKELAKLADQGKESIGKKMKSAKK